MPFGDWTPFPRRYTRVLLGVAAAAKTIVGVFKQQWETLSSVAEGERGKVKWSPGMNTTSVIPCALQRLMAAVWLKKNLKPLVIPGASFGCSSGFQRWTSWAPPMLERGLPSPVVRPGRGHGWQGLPSDASRPGSLAALHVPSPLSLSRTVCVSPVLSTQLASLATRKAAGAKGTTPFPGVSGSKARWCGGLNTAVAGRVRGSKLTAYVAILKPTRWESLLLFNDGCSWPSPLLPNRPRQLASISSATHWGKGGGWGLSTLHVHQDPKWQFTHHWGHLQWGESKLLTRWDFTLPVCASPSSHSPGWIWDRGGSGGNDLIWFAV